MGIVYAGYDVGLDRKVALKLVQSKLVGKPKIRDRMLREAQALARLSSPYVVQVYQVGEHDAGIYLAMEYVEGDDLRVWFKREDVGWRVLVRALCDAGRGLAAAHSAGLIHRDFKPENVLVGEDKRARVLDFGLVIEEGEDDFEESGEAPLVGAAVDHMPLFSTMPATDLPGAQSMSAAKSATRPRLRRVAGTPAYMSPEQHFGGAVGPYSDQFSFAITLYEALYGFRPFEGDTWKKIQEKVKRGTVPPPPANSPVPRWIHRIVLRGLSLYPEERWPSMEAMVSALEHDPRRARLRALGLTSLVVAASAASYGIAVTQLAEETVCQGLAGELEGVWDGGAKRTVEEAFTATEAPFADDAWRRVETRLDAYASSWVRSRREACEASHSGSLSDRLIEARLRCVGRRRAYFKTLVDVLGGADRAVVENAIQATASLPSIRACSDVDFLLAEEAPPDDPVTAARVEELRAQLSRAQALESTGRYEEALTIAAELRESSEALGFAPLQAEAALLEGSIYIASGRSADASEPLSEALQRALVHDLHTIAADAAAKRIFALGEGKGRFEEALAGGLVAQALVDRARADWRLSALLNNNLGGVYLLSGDQERAAESLKRTVEIIERADSAEPLLGVTHHNLGEMYLGRGDLDAAHRHYTQAVSIMEEALGESHPMSAHPRAGLGDVALRRGALSEAEGDYRRSLELMESAYGRESLYLVQPLTGLGEVSRRSGRVAEAEVYFGRVVALSDALGVQLEYLPTSLVGLGELAARRGDLAAAGERFKRAAAVREAIGADVRAIAEAALRAGEVAALEGDVERARGWFEKVLVLTEDRQQAERGGGMRRTASLGLASALSAGEEGALARSCELLQGLDLAGASPAERDTAERLQAQVCAP